MRLEYMNEQGMSMMSKKKLLNCQSTSYLKFGKYKQVCFDGVVHKTRVF